MDNKKPQMFKTVVIFLLVSLLLALPAVILAADVYPRKSIVLIVPFSPGGSVDAIARLVSTELSKKLGQTVVVQNRDGAGSIIGTEAVSKAPPDGYTLLDVSGAFLTFIAFNYKLPYDPIKDFSPVANMGTGPYVLVVHPSVPANSLKEFIALAKQKPGQIICATSGIGGTLHLGLELLQIMADVKFKIIHFKGGGPATTSLLGGHSNAFISPLITALPHIKDGKLRALATCGKKRAVLLPEVPTISETGAPGYELDGFYGIVAPAGTPKNIIEKLDKEIKAVLSSEDIEKQLLKSGVEVDYMGSSDFEEFLGKTAAKWKEFAKTTNLKIE